MKSMSIYDDQVNYDELIINGSLVILIRGIFERNIEILE